MSGYDDERDRPNRPDDDRRERPRRSPIPYAKQKVSTPAVVMLAFSILSLVMVPINLISYFRLPEMMKQQRDQVDRNPGLRPEQKQEMKKLLDKYEEILMVSTPISMVLQLVIGGLTVLGSLRMRSLQSYGWGMTAA